MKWMGRYYDGYSRGYYGFFAYIKWQRRIPVISVWLRGIFVCRLCLGLQSYFLLMYKRNVMMIKAGHWRVRALQLEHTGFSFMAALGERRLDRNYGFIKHRIFYDHYGKPIGLSNA